MTSPPSIAVERTGDACGLTIADLPVWQGLRPRPGVTASHSFRLGIPGSGPIRQITSPGFLEQIVAGYASEDYSFLTAPPGHSAWANALGDSKAAAVMRNCASRRPAAVLEIGAGSTYVGEKLRALVPSIRSYVAVDPAITGSASGIEVVRGYFPAPELAGRNFDLILGFSCLEHVPSPEDFLRNAAAALAPGGAILMSFPDTEAALARGDLNVLLHEHLTYFTAASVHWTAASAGLEVLALESANDLFTAVLGRPVESATPPCLAEMDLLTRAGAALEAMVGQRGAEIRSLLDQGKVVAFHGATNGLNNFLHLTRLGDHPEIRLFDGDAAKHGLFLPACNVAVGDPADPSYAQADVIFVSALSFFDAIAKGACQRHGLTADRLRRLEA